MSNKFDSIIFDLDGTLWDSTYAIRDIWDMVLQRHKEIKRDPITREELIKCMGYPMDHIAGMLFPDEKEEVRNSLMDEMCACENEYLEKNGGILYDGLKQTLDELKKTYKLYIVSNCQDGYIEAFIKAHGMEEYFDDTECWGRTRLPKGESNKILIKRNNLKSPVYVGDTKGDAQSAIDASIPFVFASYGFGDVEKYDYIIKSVRELLNVFN